MNKTDIANYSVQETLRSGQTVTIRAIRPEDKGGVVDVLRDLSPEAFYRRAFSPKRSLNDEELRRLTEVDFDAVVALAATMKQEGQDKIIGGGRYIRTGEAGSSAGAEVAFLIDDAHQGLGIGSRIFKHLVLIARASGIGQFEADVLPANEAMLRLFSRSGLALTRTSTQDCVHIVMALSKEGER